MLKNGESTYCGNRVDEFYYKKLYGYSTGDNAIANDILMLLMLGMIFRIIAALVISFYDRRDNDR